MNKLLLSVACIGGLLVIGAAMMAIDTVATPDRKEAVQTKIEELAEANAKKSRGARRRDVIGRTAAIYNDLSKGIFRAAPVVVVDHLPAELDGWEAYTFAPEDIDTMLQLTATTGPRAELARSKVFDSITKTTTKKALGAAGTYRKDDRMMILSGVANKQAFRDADNGKFKRAGNVRVQFGSLDGVPVAIHPSFLTHPFNGHTYPVGFRRFTVSLDNFVGLNIVTNASDADVLSLLGAIDMVALQDLLPAKTKGYAPGTGLVFAPGTAAETDVPAPTPALRAFDALTSGIDAESPEGRALRAIAEGRAHDWKTVKRRVGGKVEPTETLIDILGPAPEDHAANR